MKLKYERCKKCLGSGMVEVAHGLEVCPDCNGYGQEIVGVKDEEEDNNERAA